jgi:hypothetical protein
MLMWHQQDLKMLEEISVEESAQTEKCGLVNAQNYYSKESRQNYNW